MKRILLLFVCVIPLTIAPGCAVPAAVLKTLEFEHAQLNEDTVLIDELYTLHQTHIRTSIDALWEATYQSITARGEKLTSEWAIETLKVIRAAEKLQLAEVTKTEQNKMTAIANIKLRQQALHESSLLTVKSQEWNKDAQSFVIDLLEKQFNVSSK